MDFLSELLKFYISERPNIVIALCVFIIGPKGFKGKETSSGGNSNNNPRFISGPKSLIFSILLGFS